MKNKLTIGQARKMLPKSCRGLAPSAVTVAALRDAVQGELREFDKGDNPLSYVQVAYMNAFLVKTA